MDKIQVSKLLRERSMWLLGESWTKIKVSEPVRERGTYFVRRIMDKNTGE